MSKILNFCKKTFNKFCEQGVSDRATFIKNISVIGFVLSSLAQTTAIIFNDKIPNKEKKFLVPQEILDGLINASLFWFITSKAVNFGKLLVLKKQVLPKSIANLMTDFTCSNNNLTILKDNFLSHIAKKGTPEQVKLANNTIEGMGVVAGLSGAILTNNIITPILRNSLAGKFQQKEINKNEKIPNLNPYYANFDFSKYNYDKNRQHSTTNYNFLNAKNTGFKI